MRTGRIVIAGLTLPAMSALLVGCAAPAEREGVRLPESAESLVLDVERGWVRFLGIVPIDAARRPMLEVVVCTPDTREHEALVMTRVRPSSVHAALLALGAEPGTPGGEVWDGETFRLTEPAGPLVRVRLAPADRPNDWTDATSWYEPTRSTRAPSAEEITWRFTGSVFHGNAYVADTDGVVVGLVGFGTEVVGMSPAISEIDAKRGFDFVARPERVPAFGTPVIVELSIPDPPTAERGGN